MTSHDGRHSGTRGLLPWIAVIAVMIAVAGTVFWRQATTSADVVFLRPENGAKWIRLKRPFELRSHKPGTVTTEFRKTFTAESVTGDAKLTIRALKRATVFLDGDQIPASSNTPDDWKQSVIVPLASHLSPGSHELRVVVENNNGPALLLAYSTDLELFTGKGWEARRPGEEWSAALPVDQPAPSPELIDRFPSSLEALRKLAPLLSAIFLVVFLGTYLQARHAAISQHLQRAFPVRLNVQFVRRGLIGFWLLLALNSLVKVPTQGFDYPAHLEYIAWMTEHAVPPLATEGWQMFQPPLYYAVSAALYKICSLFFAHEISEQLLRMIPLLCGLLQIELCYRALKYTLPKREDLQGLGTLLGGLLPMNLYMSQNLGNEPLAGLLTAVAVVMGLRFLHEPEAATSRRNQWLLGIVLGLAILTKVTAILLLVPMLVVLAFSLRRGGCRGAAMLAASLRLCAGLALIAGWYFLRNWIELGKPYVGGWDPAREIVWWQDPGFRVAEHFTTFGESLVNPIYAARYGFWDAIYSSFWLDGYLSGVVLYEARPPWNELFLQAAPWLGLLPSVAILLGGLSAVRCLKSSEHYGVLLSLCCIGIYFSAMLALFLQLPIYSTAKASYTLGLIPCYAILGAAGFGLMMRNTFLRAVVYAGMACWAVTAGAAYFAV